MKVTLGDGELAAPKTVSSTTTALVISKFLLLSYNQLLHNALIYYMNK